MVFDVSKILKINSASINIEFSEVIGDLNLVDEGFEFNNPVIFTGKLTNTGNAVELDGRLVSTYKAKCYRCLKETEMELALNIKERFVRAGESAGEDDYTFEGSQIDIGKALRDNIILNLPMKQLCSEDCKGLCFRCGKNLNEEDCSCTEESTNMNMEVLRNFFNN